MQPDLSTTAAPTSCADFPWLGDIISLRRQLHRTPELALSEHRTASLVARNLRSWGWDVVEHVGGTGVVASLAAGEGTRGIALRAELDALPILEDSGVAFSSENPGQMHACGHDGHMAILLAAARYLAETRKFSGIVRAIFQPAEETGPGARDMIADGLFERFPFDVIYALHNWPGLPAGRFAVQDGPAMAAADGAIVTIRGRGGHGAAPHEAIDPVPAAASFISALQTIVSREVDPLDTAVVTVGAIRAGTVSNIIPDEVEMHVSIRAFAEDVRRRIEQRIRKLASAQAEAFGATASVEYDAGTPAVLNDPAAAHFARQIILDTFGQDGLITHFPPRMASEDFSEFLAVKPGAYMFVGNGDSRPLHSPQYQFNDAIIGPAGRLLVRLAESHLR